MIANLSSIEIKYYFCKKRTPVSNAKEQSFPYKTLLVLAATGSLDGMKNVMDDYKIVVYTRSADIPPMQYGDFFHSTRLFRIYEQTPRHKPLMVVAFAGNEAKAHLLAVVRYRWSLLPPYLFTHCRVTGEGDYNDVEPVRQEKLFGLMLNALTRRLRHRVLYVEFSNLSRKMFGYKEFRRADYFPVHWMTVHNSLHSRDPEDRLSERMKRRIANAERRGVTTTVVESEEDLQAFVRLMQAHNRLKPRRHIPDIAFFRGMLTDGNDGDARLFISKYKGHAVGCCACVYWGGNAYVWYLASLRKSYVKLHPDVATVWAVIKHAHANGYNHICFMDVGLPFRRNRFREFILRFGGKPVSSYRWFFVTVGWLNKAFKWIYKD